jgi:hypothetical protein
MANEDTTRRERKSEARNGFRISDRPVVGLGTEESARGQQAALGIVRSYGPPMLYAIGRDPTTIFACWSIDWPAVFAAKAPVDKQVYLRVCRCADGVEEKRVSVEPMAGNCFISVSDPNGRYQLDIGYFQPADFWNSVALTPIVTMPPNRVSENLIADLATIPLHLSFQRLVDLFGGSAEDLAGIIARLEARAVRDGKQVQPKERDTFRAMGLPLSRIAADWRAIREIDSDKLAKRAAALLEFGPTSPSRGFHGGWESASS